MVLRRGMGRCATCGQAAILAGVIQAGALGQSAPVNGHIIVSTRGDSGIVLLDPVSFAPTARLAAPVGLHEIAASPDGRRAVGSAYGSGPRHQTPDQRLQVVYLPDLDPSTDDAAALGPLIDLGFGNTRPNDLVFLPDSRHVLCTSEVARTVLKIDLDRAEGTVAQEPGIDGAAPSDDPIVATYAHGARAGHMLAASPDFSRLFVPSVADRTLTTIDLNTGEVLGQVLAGDGAEGIAASPDGSSVWVACNRAGTVVVFDGDGQERLERLEAPGFPFRARFVPDGSRVVITFPGDHRVRIYDAATRSVLFAVGTGEGSTPTSVAISPDGRLAAVACSGIESVVIVDVVLGEVVQTVRVGPSPDGLAWSSGW